MEDDVETRQLSQLRERLAIAQAAREDIYRRHLSRRAELMEALEATLKAEFDEVMAAAERHENEIRAEFAALKNEKAKVMAANFTPRKFRYYSFSGVFPIDLTPTNTYGIEEIITADSEHHRNTAPHNVARIGEKVIRILNRNQTPSKKYVRFVVNGPPIGWQLVDETEGGK